MSFYKCFNWYSSFVLMLDRFFFFINTLNLRLYWKILELKIFRFLAYILNYFLHHFCAFYSHLIFELFEIFNSFVILESNLDDFKL